MAPPTVLQPAIGDKAPHFSVLSSTGESIALSQFKGKYVVLYFYPKDNTPGCTVEAKEFRDLEEELANAGAVVLGVSPDSAESHCAFIERFGLSFPLLCDETHAVAEKYGVWVEKNMYGKKYLGVQRATFLLDPQGRVAHVWPRVRPEGHAEQVLAAIRGHAR